MDFRERRYFVVGINHINLYANHIVDIYKIAKTVPSTKIKYISHMSWNHAHITAQPRLLISCRREHGDELIDMLNSKFNEYVLSYGLSEDEYIFQYCELLDKYTRRHIKRYRLKCINQINENLKNCHNVIDYALNKSSRSESTADAIELLRKHNTTNAPVIRLSNGKLTEQELINKILDNYELLVDKFTECEKMLKSSSESIETLINM